MPRQHYPRIIEMSVHLNWFFTIPTHLRAEFTDAVDGYDCAKLVVANEGRVTHGVIKWKRKGKTEEQMGRLASWQYPGHVLGQYDSVDFWALPRGVWNAEVAWLNTLSDVYSYPRPIPANHLPVAYYDSLVLDYTPPTIVINPHPTHVHIPFQRPDFIPNGFLSRASFHPAFGEIFLEPLNDADMLFELAEILE